MLNLKAILTVMVIALGTLAVVNRVPQIRHLVKGETRFENGRVVRDPREEYVSKKSNL